MTQKQSDNSRQDAESFVARYWQAGAFGTLPEGRTLWGAAMRRRRRLRVAAAAGLAAVLTATAAVVWTVGDRTPAPEVAPVATLPAAVPDSVMSLTFDHAPMRDVISTVESAYGIGVAGDYPADTLLTLGWHGNAYDLIGTLNDMLGLGLAVEPAGAPAD